MTARRLVVYSLLMLAGCRTMPAGQVDAELQLIEEAIEERASSFNNALSNGDADLIIDRYASEVYVLLPDTAALRKVDLLQYFRDYLELNPVVRTVTDHISLSASLDMAWEVGWFSEEHDDGANRLVTHSQYLAVWMKEGGTWYLASQALVPSARPPESVLPTPPPGADTLHLGLPDLSTSVILPSAAGQVR